MNNEFLSANIEKLESVFLNIMYLKPEERIITPSVSFLNDLKDIINVIFDDNVCIGVRYTLNTDKPFFGVRISPNMSPADATVILTSDERIKLNKYQIEFDSKLFEIGLSDSELAAITIYEISSMMDRYDIFDELRAVIDTGALTAEDVVNIRDSINHSQLIIFAIKDTLCKLTSLVHKESPEELTNSFIQAAGLSESIISAREKIISSVSGIGGESLRSSKPIVLQWVFVMYKDVKANSAIISDTLKDAREFTGSRLEIEEIDKALQSLDRISSSIVECGSLNKFFERKNLSALNEVSLFKQLKKSGLRGIENELYEYSMKVKNCTESDDAYMIMRSLNSRLGILEDYLFNERDMNEHERNHWEYVAQQYRELRVKLSAKKFKEKQYGLFFDYSALDKLDKPSE